MSNISKFNGIIGFSFWIGPLIYTQTMQSIFKKKLLYVSDPNCVNKKNCLNKIHITFIIYVKECTYMYKRVRRFLLFSSKDFKNSRFYGHSKAYDLIIFPVLSTELTSMYIVSMFTANDIHRTYIYVYFIYVHSW